MANINQALGTDLAAIAKLLRSKGRNKDTILAHISPKEAALLKRHGGSGNINPNTGLPEFDDGEGFDAYAGGTPEQIATQNAANQTPETSVSPVYDVSGPQNQFTSYTGGSEAQPGVAAVAPKQVGQTFTPGGNLPSPVPGVVSPDQATGGVAPTSKPEDQGFLSRLTKGITDPSTLAKLGLAGGLGLFGASQAKKAGNQTQAATQQQQNIAQPYQQQGQQLVAQAQAGQLSPTSQQALDAAKAQLAQSQSNRGGVGAQQSANQIANIYQTLLDNQYKYGLQVMQIGDNISLGAIQSGLQLDQQLGVATNNFYSQLASIVGGTGTGVPYTQPRN